MVHHPPVEVGKPARLIIRFFIGFFSICQVRRVAVFVYLLYFLTCTNRHCLGGGGGGGNGGNGNGACLFGCNINLDIQRKLNKTGRDYVGQTNFTDDEYPVKVDLNESSSKELSSGDDRYEENSGGGSYNTADDNNNRKSNNGFYNALRDIAAQQGLHF